MGLFRGAVFRHSGVPENSPLSLMGRFPSLMGRFLTLMGRFPECLNGRFPSRKSPGKQRIKKRGVKRFLKVTDPDLGFSGPRIPFCAAGALWGLVTPFLDHFSKHLSSVLGRTDLYHEVRNPRPQNQERKSSPKSKFWGRKSGGRPRGYPGGRPQKIICPININTKAKAKKYYRGIDFTLVSVSMGRRSGPILLALHHVIFQK